MRRLDLPFTERVVDLDCGRAHSMIATTSKGISIGSYRLIYKSYSIRDGIELSRTMRSTDNRR